MPSRFATLKANTTARQWVPLLLVPAVFLFIAGALLVRDDDPAPLIACVTGLLIPWRLRRVLGEHPEATTGILRKARYVIIAVAAAAGFLRNHLDVAGVGGWAWLPMGLVMLYIGAFFTVWSDPSVEVVED